MTSILYGQLPSDLTSMGIGVKYSLFSVTFPVDSVDLVIWRVYCVATIKMGSSTSRLIVNLSITDPNPSNPGDNSSSIIMQPPTDPSAYTYQTMLLYGDIGIPPSSTITSRNVNIFTKAVRENPDPTGSLPSIIANNADGVSATWYTAYPNKIPMRTVIGVIGPQ